MGISYFPKAALDYKWGFTLNILMLHVDHITMASFLPVLNNGEESNETSRIFSGHVNFPETNGGISEYGGTRSNNHVEMG